MVLEREEDIPELDFMQIMGDYMTVRFLYSVDRLMLYRGVIFL